MTVNAKGVTASVGVLVLALAATSAWGRGGSGLPARTVPPISNYKNWYLREDWLQKLGLEKPETLEEWITVAKAFATQDPNGNGEQDEVALSARTLWQLEWFGASGLDLDIYYSFGFSLDNGVLSYDYISPRVSRLSRVPARAV